MAHTGALTNGMSAQLNLPFCLITSIPQSKPHAILNPPSHDKLGSRPFFPIGFLPDNSKPLPTSPPFSHFRPRHGLTSRRSMMPRGKA